MAQLYPWSLTQLRTPHMSPVPFPEDVLSVNPNDQLTDPTRRRTGDLIDNFNQYIETPLPLKIALYVTLELTEEVLNGLPDPTETAVEAADTLSERLPELLEAAHERWIPERRIRTVLADSITRIWNDLETEDDIHVADIMGAAWHAIVAIIDFPRGEIGFYRWELSMALWRLYSGVEGIFGEDAANDIIKVWWNRVFSRLAFRQEED